MIYILTLELILLFIATFDPVFGQIYRIKGSSIVFTCKFNGGILWSYRKSGSDSWTTYSSNSNIANVDVKERLSITGDSSIGEYKLNIRDLQERDMGYYICKRGGGGDGDIEQLVVIVGPTNVQINNKISNNTLEGTEGQTVQIQCTTTGGNPAPDVKLLIEGNQVVIGKRSVTYTIQTLNKSHDGHNVTCLAGYTSINNFPLNDSVHLYLIYQRSELDMRHYETMGTTDKPNVYEGLDHKIRTDKGHFGKGENYETLGTIEKPNVYEELDQKPNDSKSKIYSNTVI